MSDDHLSCDCRRSSTMRGQCDTCGATPAVLHTPLRVHGWFCGLHCPCCKSAWHRDHRALRADHDTLRQIRGGGDCRAVDGGPARGTS